MCLPSTFIHRNRSYWPFFVPLLFYRKTAAMGLNKKCDSNSNGLNISDSDASDSNSDIETSDELSDEAIRQLVRQLGSPIRKISEII